MTDALSSAARSRSIVATTPPFQPLRPRAKHREQHIPGDASAQELHLHAYARQQAQEAITNANALGVELTLPLSDEVAKRRAQHRANVEPDPPSSPRAPSFCYAGVPPSVEDVFALYKLCGGSEPEVVETLARLWGAHPLSICDVVRTWLADLPPLQLPSRIASAPAVLPPAMCERLKSATPFPAALQPWERKANARRVSFGGVEPDPVALNSLASARLHRKPPAATAPVRGSKPHLDLSSALSGLHSASTRLHAANHAGGRVMPADQDIYTLPQHPTFTPVVLSADEVARVPADFEDGGGRASGDEALRAFMARQEHSWRPGVDDVAKAPSYPGHRLRF